MKEKNRNPIAQNIKKYRLLNNMTQEELSGKLFLDTQYYAQLERGERNFTIDKIIQACKLFHIGIENIIEIDKSELTDTGELCQKLSSSLNTLTHSQLVLLEKFITDFLPYVK